MSWENALLINSPRYEIEVNKMGQNNPHFLTVFQQGSEGSTPNMWGWWFYPASWRHREMPGL